MPGAFVLFLGSAAATCAGLLFLVAAVAKLRHRAELPAVIANYRLLPPPAIAPAALLLPWTEGVIGLTLLVGGVAAQIAAWAAIALLLLFAGGMAVNIRRGRSHIDCGCGIGGLRQPLRAALVRRNLVLAASLVTLALMPGTLPVSGRLLATAAGAVAFLLVLLLDALLALPGNRALAA